LALFPEARDYLEVYESHGCATPRTILAHCIHLCEQQWARVRALDLAVAHCPDSNFFLGSGCMALATALEHNIRVGLGTDVGAGRTFSLRRTAAAAYDAALIREAPIAPELLLWLATRGGARALHKDQLGCLAPGYEADLVVIEAPAELELAPLIDALLFHHDAGPVTATLVRGQLL
jgi:guanine deaminase